MLPLIRSVFSLNARSPYSSLVPRDIPASKKKKVCGQINTLRTKFLTCRLSMHIIM